MVEIAVVLDAGLGDQIGRAQRPRRRRREPARKRLAGVLVVQRHALGDGGALGVLVEVPVVARVVHAVRHVFPAALVHRPMDFGKHFEHRVVERHGAAHLVTVEHFQQAPEPDPVAVLAYAVVENVGVWRARPRITHPNELGHELVVLDVRHDPQRYARIAGPAQRRSLDDRRVIEARGWHGRIVLEGGSRMERVEAGRTEAIALTLHCCR